jgi:hypothetical protein
VPPRGRDDPRSDRRIVPEFRRVLGWDGSGRRSRAGAGRVARRIVRRRGVRDAGVADDVAILILDVLDARTDRLPRERDATRRAAMTPVDATRRLGRHLHVRAFRLDDRRKPVAPTSHPRAAD